MNIQFLSQVSTGQNNVADRVLACVLILPLLPTWLLNLFCGILSQDSSILTENKHDAFGRSITLHRFAYGVFCKSLYLVDVILGRVNLCGVSIDQDEIIEAKRDIRLAPGLISLYDIYKRIGLQNKTQLELIYEQQQQFNGLAKYKLIIKGIVSYLLYNNENFITPKRFKIFGVRINNLTMTEAVDWIIGCKNNVKSNVQLGFFVNVNSVNLTFDYPDFRQKLAQGNKVFSDGSGVRLAAKHKKIHIKGNINGTDLLPELCARLEIEQQSIFLLGSEIGIAEVCARKLQQKYPSLKIAGHHHGYFEQNNSAAVIDIINGSGADILLVAMGSPIQENWLLKNRDELNCHCALAVGGLLDFYAEKISRSPLWLREIGMEWVWRLLQEPGKKWRRYILGNPRFLYHTFIA